MSPKVKYGNINGQKDLTFMLTHSCILITTLSLHIYVSKDMIIKYELSTTLTVCRLTGVDADAQWCPPNVYRDGRLK
jgi:hypothetical protein